MSVQYQESDVMFEAVLLALFVELGFRAGWDVHPGDPPRMAFISKEIVIDDYKKVTST